MTNQSIRRAKLKALTGTIFKSSMLLAAICLSTTLGCEPLSQRGKTEAFDTAMSLHDGDLPSGVDPNDTQLSNHEYFTRVHIDLTGSRPRVETLLEIDHNPDFLSSAINQLLEDPRLFNQIRIIFAPAFKTLIDEYELVADLEDPILSRIIGEEPLNLLAHILAHDLPYSELVMAPYTVVDQRLLTLWPLTVLETEQQVKALENDEYSQGLVLATYHDQRPMSGVLSMNSMWWRHTSTVENANRGRAEALSQAFLCEGWLDRPILFPTDIDLSDRELMHNAIQSHPACVSCHATLDPVASYLWGFMNEEVDVRQRSSYRPQQELDWRTQTEVEPSYFGIKGGGSILDLGAHIASDPRFTRCATKRVYEALTGQKDLSLHDPALDQHHQHFLLSGLNLKELLRSIISDSNYRLASNYKVMTASLLSSELASMTGYQPSADGRVLMESDQHLRQIAGGGEGRASLTSSAGLILTQYRLSEGAAWYLIAEEAGHTDQGGQLGELIREYDTRFLPTQDQVIMLWSTILSQLPSHDPASIAELMRLVTELKEQAEEPEEVWQALITSLLADPARLLY